MTYIYNLALSFGLPIIISYYFLCKSRKKIKKKDINNKIILITGCDSGFGAGLAQKSLAMGFDVIAACYTKQGESNLISKKNKDGKLYTYVCDLSSEEGVNSLVNFTISHIENRGLYALVNNAGLCIPGNIEWLPINIYKKTMDLNFYAPVNLTQKLIIQIKKAQGRVINVTSVDGFIPLPTNSAYCASKHALESFSDTLRCEMLPWGVKVIVVQPATMRTPLALSYADNWLDLFKETVNNNNSLVEDYDIEWASQIALQMKEGIEKVIESPYQTVCALSDALVLVDPPTRINTGIMSKFFFKPISKMPDKIRDYILYNASFRKSIPTKLNLANVLPPIGNISHITIKVKDLNESIIWYQKLGFLRIGQSINGTQFLRSGKNPFWQPLLLLSEDKFMKERGPSYVSGITRLCIYSTNINNVIEQLKLKKINPISNPANGKEGTIVAYKDPDGFIVYYIQFNCNVLNIMLNIITKWYNIKDPLLFHVTVNVTDSDKYFNCFKEIGFSRTLFQSGSDLKQKPEMDMLPAFGLSEDSTIIKNIKLTKLPSSSFLLTVMEWTEPRTIHFGSEKLNTLCISVNDVTSEIMRLSDLGIKTENAKLVSYPIFGNALVGKLFIDNTCIELCEFVGLSSLNINE